MDLKKEQQGETLVITPMIERFDAGLALPFKDEIAKIIEEGHCDLLLNFSEVAFIDSTGLGAIVSVLKALGSRGTVSICSLNDSVQKLFELTRMDKVFSIYDTQDEALNSLTV